MFSLSQSSAWQCCSTEAPWRSFINVKVTTTSKELPFHKRCQNAISPSTNWPPHLFVLNFTKRKAEFCPGFFPYGLDCPSPYFKYLQATPMPVHVGRWAHPQNHTYSPQHFNRHLVRVSSFLLSVFLQPHTFHQSTLHCQSPIPI